MIWSAGRYGCRLAACDSVPSALGRHNVLAQSDIDHSAPRTNTFNSHGSVLLQFRNSNSASLASGGYDLKFEYLLYC